MGQFRADNPFSKLSWFKDLDELVAWTKSQAPPTPHPWHDHGYAPCVHRGKIMGLYRKNFKIGRADARAAYHDLTRNGLVEERFGDKPRWWVRLLRIPVFIVALLVSWAGDSDMDLSKGEEPYLCTIYRV